MATSKRMKLSAALLTLMIAGWSGIAAAKPCKDFDIKVQNNFEHDGTPVQIMVVDFDYWDDEKGKWREENFVRNLVIDSGDTTILPIAISSMSATSPASSFGLNLST